MAVGELGGAGPSLAVARAKRMIAQLRTRGFRAFLDSRGGLAISDTRPVRSGEKARDMSKYFPIVKTLEALNAGLDEDPELLGPFGPLHTGEETKTGYWLGADELRVTFNTALAGVHALAGALVHVSPPLDCPPLRWAAAQRGFRAFVEDGWADRALAAGWGADELFHLPPLWSRIAETGVSWLIGDRRVVEVTGKSITIETSSGSRLAFRRGGQEHVP